MLSSLSIENAGTILYAADNHNAMVLREHCVQFVLRNFDSVTKTTAFEEMGRNNVELVLEILKRR